MKIAEMSIGGTGENEEAAAKRYRLGGGSGVMVVKIWLRHRRPKSESGGGVAGGILAEKRKMKWHQRKPGEN
jgi:hypothetical protein